MASYVVLARKWRPAQFADIVGQTHIVRTLMNAIRSERIHQAYLFTGSRGIGKTSIARIFAKVIRCESAQTQAESDWLHSCDQCSSCKEITSGASVDVIEIDGASNNGVDAVREIRENAKYLPATGQRKIYIIDEVHMLTTAAFNALLKTLEEPPPHVIFIFATTEPHKIPATILSRCQRFDYRRVTVAQIQGRLAQIAQAEGVQAEPGALALIARAAEGSMRDSLSLLDQVIAFSGTQITTQSVRESIGLIESQTLLGILSGIFGKKPLEALSHVEQAYQRGHDLRVLTRSLIEFLHGAILAKIGSPNSATLELSEEEWKELRSIAELRPLEEIELIFQVLHHGLDWIARSPQPKVVLDVLLVKCATAEALMVVDAASDNSGAGPEAKPKSAAAPILPQAGAVLKTAVVPSPAAPIAPSEPAAPTVSAALVPQPASKTLVKNWEGFIEHVRKSRPLLASMLEHGTCQLADGLLNVLFNQKDEYFKEQLQTRAYNEQLLTLSKEYFEKHMRVQISLGAAGEEPRESLAARKEREQREREAAARQAVQNHPIIMEAKALFGGEMGPIELTEDPEHA